MPHIVLAAEPPLISTALPSARYKCSARSVSTRVIEPFTSVVSVDEVVVRVRDDVDERIAHADHVVAHLGRPVWIGHVGKRYRVGPSRGPLACAP
jgi:hypothetical protein